MKTLKNEKLTALIIEDSEIDLFIIKDTLNDTDLFGDMVSFDTAEKAMEYLKQPENAGNLPDLLLLDLNLPYMNGFEFLDEMDYFFRDVETSSILIFMMTSSTEKRDYEKFEKYPTAREFIVKPVIGLDLKERLEKYYVLH